MQRRKLTRCLFVEFEQHRVVEQQLEHVIVSHYHGDHVGNVDMFPASTLLIQKAELDWAFAEAKASLAKAA